MSASARATCSSGRRDGVRVTVSAFDDVLDDVPHAQGYYDPRERTREVVLEVPCPGGCGSLVYYRAGTDGHGNEVDDTEPCTSCRGAPALYVPAGHKLSQCSACGAPFSQPARRQHRLCPRCNA